MRRALLRSVPQERAGTAVPPHVPAPIGGWNTRDSLADMSPVDAPVLDNWFPRGSYCQERGGSSDWATGISGTVKTLFAYTPTSGVNKFFAASDAGIYDITAGGAVGATVRSLTNGEWNQISFTNSAGSSYSWGCNGSDGPYYFDGAVWTVPTITVLGTPANLNWCWLFKHRIFAIEKNTMNAWYLPVDSIQGAAAQLPLGNLFKRGGTLLSGTSWSLDSGIGPDDYCLFITSEGELAVYAGTDPASASTFYLVGVYYVGRPLGRRCFCRFGADVVVITESGVFPLTKLLRYGNVNFGAAFSKKIQPSISAQIQTNFTKFGWSATVYPQFDALIVNIPQTGVNNVQYVMNTVTGAWCSFSGWNANCFEVFGGTLYFGLPSGYVEKAWDGQLANDKGSDIVCLVQQAYNYFGSAGRLKKIGMFRPLLTYDGSIEVRTGISADFKPTLPTSITPRSASTTGSPWDTSPWDTSSWATGADTVKFWRGASHPPGFALGLVMQTASNNCATLQWAGTDYVIEGGGIL